MGVDEHQPDRLACIDRRFHRPRDIVSANLETVRRRNHLSRHRPNGVAQKTGDATHAAARPRKNEHARLVRSLSAQASLDHPPRRRFNRELRFLGERTGWKCCALAYRLEFSHAQARQIDVGNECSDRSTYSDAYSMVTDPTGATRRQVPGGPPGRYP